MTQPHLLGGNARLGFVATPGTAGPPMPALIRIDPESGLDVDIPIAPGGNLIDPFREMTDPPEFLHFSDDKGRLTFGGCFGMRRTMNSGTGCGRWSLKAAYAVEGSDFGDNLVETVSLLQSEISGLNDWMGWPSTTMTFKQNAEGEPEEVGIVKKMLDPLEISLGTQRLRFIPTVKTRDFVFSDDETTIETLSDEPEPWSKHFPLHHGIRNLIALCFWSPVDFLSHRLRHPGEPRLLPTGKKLPPPTRVLHYLHHTRRTHRNVVVAPKVRSEHFHFSDFGVDGVERYVRLDKTHSRAIAPLMSYLYLVGLPIETQITHIGICLEALRYADRVEAGDSKNAADSEPIGIRAKTLAENVASPIQEILGDPDIWSRKFAACYNSVKHAKRDLADPGDTFWLIRSGALLARVCLLQRAGVSPDSIHRMNYSSWWHPMKEGVASVLASA